MGKQALIAVALMWAAGFCLAADPGHNDDLAGVVRDLGSPDYGVRDAAQHRLSAMPRELHDALKQLAAQSTDAEIRERLVARVEEIEELNAIDPPPISLHLKGASSDEMFDKLGESLKIGLPRYMDQPKGPYTLDAENKPFWDVFRELSLQHPVMLPNGYWENTALINSRGDAAKIERHMGVTVIGVTAPFRKEQIHGGAVFLADPEPPVPDDAKKISMLLEYVTDPRVPVIGRWTPLMEKITDESGKVLLNQQPGTESPMMSIGAATWGESKELLIPKTGGSKLLTIKGEVRVLVRVSSRTEEVGDLEKKVGATFVFGETRVTLASLKIGTVSEEGYYRSDLALRYESPGDVPVEIMVTDKNGDVVFEDVAATSSNMGLSSPRPSVGPFKLTVKIVEHAKDWRIPFLLKDVPLP